MPTLKGVLQDAANRRVAVGHFNFSELVVLQAAVEAATELGVPVVMGVSEGERAFLGVRQAAALLRSLQDENGPEIFLNADHTHSIEKVEEAAGQDLTWWCSTLPRSRSNRILRKRGEVWKR
jgi:fructose-bisphosphate aldolase class II